MGNRAALIIATGTYGDEALRQLRSPEQDAAALSRVLGDPRVGNFHVLKVVDQTEASIRLAIHRFFANRNRDDLLLLHLSCHGIKDDEGQLYFAATDTTRQALEVTAVSAKFLNEQMLRSRARSIVLLLDCCYAGAFAAGAKSDEGVHLKERFEGHGRAILTASNEIEYAWEGEALSGQGQPSVFTSAIVQGLESGDADRDGDGHVSLHELHEYVTECMLSTERKQTPLKWELGIEGGLYVARNPRPRPALPREILQALGFPLPSVRAAVVSDLAQLLRGTQPRIKKAARHALEQLQHDDSVMVQQAARHALGVSDNRTTPLEAGAVHNEDKRQEPPDNKAGREPTPTVTHQREVSLDTARRLKASSGRGALPADLGRDYRQIGPNIEPGRAASLLVVKHVRTGEDRVLKLYDPDVQLEPDALDRVKAMRHDQTPRLHAHGQTTDGQWYELREHFKGPNLVEYCRLQGGSLTGRAFYTAVREVYEAVAALHSAGFVHLDIKPEIILVREQDPLELILIDLGLSALGDVSTHSIFGRVARYNYQAPEFVGGPLGPPADWWSVGMIFAMLATGHTPYAGISEHSIHHEQLNHVPPPIVAEINDYRVRNLCRGLTRYRLENRWAADQVTRWLLGGNPDVVDDGVPVSAH